MSIEFYIKNSATNEKIKRMIDLFDFGYDEEEWFEMTKEEKMDVVQQWIEDELIFGYREVAQ